PARPRAMDILRTIRYAVCNMARDVVVRMAYGAAYTAYVVVVDRRPARRGQVRREPSTLYRDARHGRDDRVSYRIPPRARLLVLLWSRYRRTLERRDAGLHAADRASGRPRVARPRARLGR